MSTFSFHNQVVLITGAAFGIGKNIAMKFAEAGAIVVIADRDRKAGMQLLNEGPLPKGDLQFIHVDLSHRNSVKNLIQKVSRKFKRLDVLVNNASSGERKTLLQETEKNWDETMAVNLRAPFFLSQQVIPLMERTGGGVIVNIGSVAASLTCHQSPNYHMAKAGLIQMTRYLATNGGPYGVRVNAVSPGFIVRDEDRARYERRDNLRYRQTAEFCHPLGQVGTSDDVANAVLFLSSPLAQFITGQALTVDGGLTLEEQSGLVFRWEQNKRRGHGSRSQK